MKPKVQTQSELKKKYPDCFLPMKIRVQSEFIPTNRPSFNEWLAKINNYEN